MSNRRQVIANYFNMWLDKQKITKQLGKTRKPYFCNSKPNLYIVTFIKYIKKTIKTMLSNATPIMHFAKFIYYFAKFIYYFTVKLGLLRKP